MLQAEYRYKQRDGCRNCARNQQNRFCLVLFFFLIRDSCSRAVINKAREANKQLDSWAQGHGVLSFILWTVYGQWWFYAQMGGGCKARFLEKSIWQLHAEEVEGNKTMVCYTFVKTHQIYTWNCQILWYVLIHYTSPRLIFGKQRTITKSGMRQVLKVQAVKLQTFSDWGEFSSVLKPADHMHLFSSSVTSHLWSKIRHGGVFIPQKSVTATNKGFIPPWVVVQHSPAHHCVNSTQGLIWIWH